MTHDSDCATNNAPALPAGPCDCSAQLVKWEDLANAASPRPWIHFGDTCVELGRRGGFDLRGTPNPDKDAAFIAAAREAIPALIRMVRERDAAIRALETNCRDFNEAGLEALRQKEEASRNSQFWQNLAEALQNDCDTFKARATAAETRVKELDAQLLNAVSHWDSFIEMTASRKTPGDEEMIDEERNQIARMRAALGRQA